jgi:hypothetical protein
MNWKCLPLIKKVVLEYYRKNFLLEICVLMHESLNMLNLSSP